MIIAPPLPTLTARCCGSTDIPTSISVDGPILYPLTKRHLKRRMKRDRRFRSTGISAKKIFLLRSPRRYDPDYSEHVYAKALLSNGGRQLQENLRLLFVRVGFILWAKASDQWSDLNSNKIKMQVVTLHHWFPFPLYRLGNWQTKISRWYDHMNKT